MPLILVSFHEVNWCVSSHAVEAALWGIFIIATNAHYSDYVIEDIDWFR